MQKRLSVILMAIGLVILTACNSTDKKNTSTTTPVPQPKSTAVTTPTQQEENAYGDIDIDLTKMSATMVYSEVYNIMNEPTSYIGKTIKMTGDYYNYASYDGTVIFPACVIADATACCSQGIEFVLSDGKYPTEEGTEVTVVGVFKAYTDTTDGGTYYHLENAILL